MVQLLQQVTLTALEGGDLVFGGENCVCFVVGVFGGDICVCFEGNSIVFGCG